MAATDLSEDLVVAGRRLLVALDAAGLGAQGGAWVFDHEIGDWRFVVATSLVDTMGRTKVYRRLLGVFEKLDMPKDLTISDIHLMSPRGPLFKTIAGALRIENGAAQFENCVVNGTKFDAVVYRWVGVPTREDATRIDKEFKQRVKELSG